MPRSAQTFWKLRLPASLPYLFASMKIAVAIALVGAIVGELPTGAVAGLGARLLATAPITARRSRSGRRC
jgi:NitT/TauT family transport system permease protein